MEGDAVRTGCVVYRYFGSTSVFTKQSLSASSSMSIALKYYDTLNLC